MFVEGKSRTVFFPSDTPIYGICRDGTKNNNIRACEHLILGQFRMGARSAIYAPLPKRGLGGGAKPGEYSKIILFLFLPRPLKALL